MPILKMREATEFQSSWIAVYNKIYFRVLLQPIWAGEVSIVIVIDKQYNLVSSSKENAMVQTKKIKNGQLSILCIAKM